MYAGTYTERSHKYWYSTGNKNCIWTATKSYKLTLLKNHALKSQRCGCCSLEIIHCSIAFIDSLQKNFWQEGFQVRELAVSEIGKVNILTTKNFIFLPWYDVMCMLVLVKYNKIPVLQNK